MINGRPLILRTSWLIAFGRVVLLFSLFMLAEITTTNAVYLDMLQLNMFLHTELILREKNEKITIAYSGKKLS